MRTQGAASGPGSRCSHHLSPPPFPPPPCRTSPTTGEEVGEKTGEKYNNKVELSQRLPTAHLRPSQATQMRAAAGRRTQESGAGSPVPPSDPQLGGGTWESRENNLPPPPPRPLANPFPALRPWQQRVEATALYNRGRAGRPSPSGTLACSRHPGSGKAWAPLHSLGKLRPGRLTGLAQGVCVWG